MKQQYLINVGKKDIRVAVVEDGNLVQLLVEPTDERAILGNIYKGIVRDVKPGIHAAFVDIGLERNAFLHFDDIQGKTVDFSLGRTSDGQRKRRARRGRPEGGEHGEAASFDPAHELKSGNPLIVQVVKEGIGSKGPRVTTHISLPGRYLVMLSFAEQEGGVSRKIEDVRERRRLRKILQDLSSGDQAYIVRTAGLDQPAEEIKGDVGFLERSWRAIRQKYTQVTGPALIYNDHDIIYRVVRDIVASDADEIWVDSRAAFRQAQRLVERMVPAIADRVRCYSHPLKNVFDEFEIEKQLQKALRRKVWLRNGGHLIFDEMEAMTAIDVNTGKYTGGRDQDKTVFRTNMEAARTIAQQLRLRDIGGLIVIDFIDMQNEQNKKHLMDEFKGLLRGDKAKTTVLGVSEFGLVEMTRKRVRRSLKGFFFQDCPECGGSGEVFTREQAWRNLRAELVGRLETAPRPSLRVTLHPDQKAYIETEHGEDLQRWRSRYRIELELVGDNTLLPEHYRIAEIAGAAGRRRRNAGSRMGSSASKDRSTRQAGAQPATSREES